MRNVYRGQHYNNFPYENWQAIYIYIFCDSVCVCVSRRQRERSLIEEKKNTKIGTRIIFNK